MIDPVRILDRFGDEAFLCELWQKARYQITAELQAIDAHQSTNDPTPTLSQKLHKLRGLLSNFLEESQTVLLLRQCEEDCKSNHGRVCPKLWESFRETLNQESRVLERWLDERGYPCPQSKAF